MAVCGKCNSRTGVHLILDWYTIRKKNDTNSPEEVMTIHQTETSPAPLKVTLSSFLFIVPRHALDA